MGAEFYNNGRKLEDELGMDRMATLTKQMQAGVPVGKLLELVKDEWGAFPTRARSTVQTVLFRYRREVIAKEAHERIIEVVGKGGHMKVIDSMGELQALVTRQRARVEKAFTVESKSPLLMSQVTAELRLLKEMCRDLAYLQIETGILPRAPKVMTGTGMMVDPQGQTTKFAWQQTDEDLLARLEAPGPKVIDGQLEPR